MKIGIDIREFQKGRYTGIRDIVGNFLMQARTSREHEFVFFGNQDTDFVSFPFPGEHVVIEQRNTLFWDQVKLPVELKKHGVDVFFSPYIKTPFWRVCPFVNMVCDIIPIRISRFKGVKAFFDKIYFLSYAFISGHRALKVITLSEYSKNMISRIFCLDRGKIEVVYPAVGMSVISMDKDKKRGLIEKYDLKRPYILYVGNFKPHKNVARLIEAFSLLPDSVKDAYRLVLLGGFDKEMKSVRDLIRKRGLTEKALAIENMDHDSVSVFMENAFIFVFPSLAEGFGIPPVEAMASGVPVAASDILPMTEVLADAAVFFDPYRPEDISRTLKRLIEDRDLRERCISRGKTRVLLFNTRNVYRKIMGAMEYAGEEKTLCVSSEFPPIKGGIATQVYNLWRRLPINRTVILTSAVKEKCRGRNVDGDLNIVRRVYPTGRDIFSRAARTFMLTYYVWRELRLRNVRVIHAAQAISAGFAALIAGHIRHVPYVVYSYSADVLEFRRNPVTKWLLKRVFEGATHVVANSNFTKKLIMENSLAAENKISVSTPAVDTAVFNADKKDASLRDRYKIPTGCKILLTVSRLAPRKGHDNIIKALAKVIYEYPDVVYVIAGVGPEKNMLIKLAEVSGVKDKVIFTGEVPEGELVFYYNACDAFIMTSRFIEKKGDVEGFGTVYLEAAACGKPVIAGRSGGVSEAVVDGQTGILVDPENVDEIAKAVLTLLKDGGYAGKLGSNGLSRVRRDFTWDVRAGELKKFV